MSTLDDIDYLDTLKVQTVSGDNAPSIFANGRHQVAIEIIVRAATKDDKPFKSADELHKGLYLCFADDDTKLNWKGANGWSYTDEEGEYNGESMELANGTRSAAVAADDGTMTFKWYVSSTIAQTRRISVSVYTSTKHFSTADNPSGAEKSSVHIEARPPIDYSDRDNTEIKSGAFSTLATNLFWESNLPFLNIYKGHWDGTSKRRIVEIHPSSRTGQTKFKKHEVTYDPVHNYDISTGEHGWHGETTDCFGAILMAKPCAVIGRSQNDEDFQISMWFSRRNDISIDGPAYIGTNHYIYQLRPKVELEKHMNDNEHGIPSLLLYQFAFPIGWHSWQHNWNSKVNSPTVKVTDYYGNEGSFQLVFNSDTNFDEPGKM